MKVKIFTSAEIPFDRMESNINEFLASDKIGHVYFVKEIVRRDEIIISIFYDVYCPQD